MSLWIYLHQEGAEDEVYSANITHNLGRMAAEAGLYKWIWRPDEAGVTTAAQLIEPLRFGLALLKSDPDRFEALAPSNGWGTYQGFVGFVEEFLAAGDDSPSASVSASR